jgi:tRNA A37 threonylcarbamoyladenosine modification protein TsaB
MLGMAWQIPIVAVDTLEVIAAKLHHRLGHDFDGTLIPVINAFRGQVFSSAWSVGPFGRFVPILRCQVVDAAQWCSQPLKSLVAPPTAEDCSAEPATSEPRHQPKTVDHQELVVAGPGLKVYQPIDPVQSFPDLVPDAHWVGAVGWRGFTAGRAVNANTLMANYVRPSAAEEKRSEVPGSPSA